MGVYRMRLNALIAAISVLSMLLPAASRAGGDTRSGKAAESTAQKSQAAAQTLRLAKVTNLMGMDLQNEQGGGIGEIETLMIDLTSGRIAYAILEVGGWLDIGDEHLAAPWHALSMQPGAQVMTLTVDKAKLKKAPRVEQTGGQSRLTAYGSLISTAIMAIRRTLNFRSSMWTSSISCAPTA